MKRTNKNIITNAEKYRQIKKIWNDKTLNTFEMLHEIDQIIKG